MTQGWLVLTRKRGESIVIDDDIEVVVSEIRGSGEDAQIKLAIRAPREVVVLRREIADARAAEARRAA